MKVLMSFLLCPLFYKILDPPEYLGFRLGKATFKMDLYVHVHASISTSHHPKSSVYTHTAGK